MQFKKLKAIFTDENDDIDGVLLCIIGAVIFGCYLTYHQAFTTTLGFDAEKFGNMIAYILGAGGAGYGAKRYGEKYGRSSPDVPQS